MGEIDIKNKRTDHFDRFFRVVLGGPLLDRIDIHIEVPRVDYEKLSGDRVGESSEAIRARVQAARDIQLARFSKIESLNIVVNADMRVGSEDIQAAHLAEALQYRPKLIMG